MNKETRLVALTVVLSEAEYRKLNRFKALTPDGTMNNVIRSKLGLQPRARGQRLPDAVVLKEGEYLSEINEIL